MKLGFRKLWCLSFWFPVKVRGCKYRDKQITPTDRVSKCYTIDHVSCDWGIVTLWLLMLMAWYSFSWITHFLHLHFKYKWDDKVSFRLHTFFPFVFDHVWIPGAVALRWHISAGHQGILKWKICPGILHYLNQGNSRSRYKDYCELSLI